jgi:hypothetical protein
MTLPGLVAANNLSDVVDRERAWDNLGSSVSTNIPIPSPSLDLNFASNRSLVDDISGNNLITFSRASTGTFVGSNGLIQTATSGVPRFDHNPTTGESLGLLVEEARTNLVVYSEQFDNAAWTKDGTTVTANSIVAPDGTLTADKLIETATTAVHRTYYGMTVANSTPHTTSVYAKAGERSWMSLAGTSNARAWFNLATGAVGTVEASLTASIQSVGSGWYRCIVTQTTFVTAGYLDVAVASADNTYSYTGNGTSGIHVWGAQLEAGSFPTSYIPTVASTVTRAADVASITGANFSSWYNQSQGTLFCSFLTAKQDASASTLSIVALNNDTVIEHVGISRSFDPLQLNVNIVTGYTTQASFTFYSIPYGIKKVALGFAANNSTCVVNGTTSAVDTSISMPSPNQLLLGTDTGYTDYALNSTIARLAYYPVRLADLALQYLTSASGSPSSTTYPYTFTIKGKDTLALNSVSNASTRDFVFIKGLSTSAQSRLTTAAQQVASGTVFQDAAMLKASPTTSGNYLFSSGVTLSGVSTRINGTPALSIATSPFSGSTATASILLRELQPQANWRITEPMSSGTIASPEFAIPFETNDFVLFMKAGQN